ncbi:hypothetical protein C8R46DRAFT_1106880 [Mycena filopes]|nr:hypothetical protein C8R46DRAFT_1106880 [Mycena filopes]
MASPFTPQLGTNYCPTDEEIPAINALLVAPTLRLHLLHAEIAKLQEALDKLAKEQESLAAYVDAHKALLSPVRRLPLDVLQEIFLACAPSHRNCVMSASEAPVLLGRVCSSWRAIAYSTPRLWARIHIVEPQQFYGPDPALAGVKAAQRLEGVKVWLGRSGQCPLSISLQSRSENGPESSESATSFLPALIPLAPRWQHIEFTVSPVALDSLLHLTERDVPLLESIKLQHEYRFPSPGMQLERFEMLRAPRIASFRVSGCNSISQVLPLRWDQLTVLEMSGPTWETSMTSDRVLAILRRCPKLGTCQLSVNDLPMDVDGQSPGATIELKHLRTLVLHCEFVEPTLALLMARLSLPDLRDFSLHGQAAAPTPAFLAPFFARWSRLESLHVSTNIFSKSSLLDSLRTLPDTLKQLTIFDTGIPTGNLVPQGGVPPRTCLDDDLLALLGEAAAPCPALESLCLDYCTDVSDKALLRFITARMSGGPEAKLKRVKVSFNRFMTLDILPSIQAFVEDGLDVQLMHTPLFKMQSSPWQGLDDAPAVPPPWY